MRLEAWEKQFSSSQFCHGLHILIPMALMSRLRQSIHLCFKLPGFLLPGGTISIVFLPTYSWSRLLTWPNHLNIALHAPLCDFLYFKSLPDVIVSRIRIDQTFLIIDQFHFYHNFPRYCTRKIVQLTTWTVFNFKWNIVKLSIWLQVPYVYGTCTFGITRIHIDCRWQ